jgi:trans-aconitate 2-methyltransferase
VWQPDVYERFKHARDQPFHDLLALCTASPGGRMVDLGCGTGSLTRLAHETLGVAETVGIDKSPNMLAEAAAQVVPGLHFVEGDLDTAEPDGSYDIVISNAALHWLPDQPTVLSRWVAGLRAGGQLAFQVPANFDHPSHTAAYDVAAEPEFASMLSASAEAEPGVLRPREYSTLLDRLGLAEQHVRLQVYPQRLPSSADVVEWTRGTFLTRWQRALPPDVFERFVDRYRERLLEEIGDHRPYLFTFDRILCWGRARVPD